MSEETNDVGGLEDFSVQSSRTLQNNYGRLTQSVLLSLDGSTPLQLISQAQLIIEY
jgi:hypothetical protein